MPVARFEMPDGRIARFEVPEGTTPEQAQVLMEQAASEMEAPKPAMSDKKYDQNAAAGFLRSMGQGATLGFSDEIAGGVGALAAKASGDKAPIGQIYGDIRESIAGRQKEFAQEHPVADVAAQIVGGLPVGGAAFKGATTLPQIAKAGAKSGAIMGGAYGAGTAEQGLEARAKGAGTGALVGGAVGALAPVAITGVGRVSGAAIQKAKEALSPQISKGVEDLAEAMTDDEAAAIVGEIAERTGLTTDDIAEKLAKLGPKATLADVDENFTYALHDAISRFSPAKGAVRKQYAERIIGEHGDTLKSLSNNFDNYTADDVYKALETSAKERSKIAGPLYDKAFSSAIPENLSKNPVFGVDNVQDALKQANRMAALDTERVTRLKSGEMKTGKLNPVERLHYAKQILWDQAESLRRVGEKRKAQLIDGQRKEIDKVLNQIPEYAQARKIWSSSMEADNAAQVGRDIFKLNSREFAEEVASMNPHEKEMAKMGALSSASDKIEGVADRRSVSRKLVENEAMRKKVEALFGGKGEIEALTANADKWDTFRRTNGIISQQSRTREFSQANQEMQTIMQAVSQSAKERVLSLIKGDRLNAQRASSVAKILSQEGLTKSDIDRIVAINRKMFSPALGTQAASMAVTREAVKPLIQMQQPDKLQNYAR
jgi:hypothetical protein